MTRNTLHPAYDRVMELVCLLPPGWKGAELRHVASDMGMGHKAPMFLKVIRDAMDKGWVWLIGESVGLTSTREHESMRAGEKWFDEVYPPRVTSAA